MDLYESLASLAENEEGFGLALGVFDGVHLGHQAVINAARGVGSTGVLTFDPHPVDILAPSRSPRRILANLEHKKRILATLGVDFLVVIDFTHDFAAQEAESFAAELLATGVSRLTAGEDWTFGKKRGGDMIRLAEWAKERAEVIAVPAVLHDGERISSTRIRQALSDQKLDQAADLLGRPYSVFGEVVKGKQLGRTIGFPTANVAVSEEQLPPNGVYLIEGNGSRGVANIGVRPTVGQSSRRSLEVHLFSDDIPNAYGWPLEVSFLEKIRDEKKFPSLDELKGQIARDIAHAKNS